MAAWYAAPAEPRLAAISAPTLVMAGEEDVVIPAANAALLSAAIGGAEQRLFPGCGHAFMAQEAPAVAAAIRGFLERHRQGTGDGANIAPPVEPNRGG